MRGGRGRGRGRGRGNNDKSINMPDLMGQTMLAVGQSSFYQSTAADKPMPMFPTAYVKRFVWDEKDVDQGAELYMMRKMAELEAWNATSPYNLDSTATPSSSTASKSAASAPAASKRLLAYIKDIRYTDVYSKGLVVARQLTGTKRKGPGTKSGPSKPKRIALDIDLLAAREVDGESDSDAEEGEGNAPPRRPVGEGEEEFEDELLEEEEEEDYNDYAEAHGDDDDEDDGGGDYDGEY